MPSQTKARQLAKKFDETYPESLSERLVWWCRSLGIDRSRFLRMMGLSADQAKRLKDASWTDLLKNNEWEEKAWWVEGKLHDLLAMFDYDWHALADRLHHPRDASEKEPTRITRERGGIVKLRPEPSNGETETLLNQLARGGPESFTALISYLTGEHSS